MYSTFVNLFADPNPTRTAERREFFLGPLIFVITGSFFLFWLSQLVLGIATSQVVDLTEAISKICVWFVFLYLLRFYKIRQLVVAAMLVAGSYVYLSPVYGTHTNLQPLIYIIQLIAYMLLPRWWSLAHTCALLLASFWIQHSSLSAEFNPLNHVAISGSVLTAWWFWDALMLQGSKQEWRIGFQRAWLVILLIMVALQVVEYSFFEPEQWQPPWLNAFKSLLIVAVLFISRRNIKLASTLIIIAAILAVPASFFASGNSVRALMYFISTFPFLFFGLGSTTALILSTLVVVMFFVANTEWIVGPGFEIAWRYVQTSVVMLASLWLVKERLATGQLRVQKTNGFDALFHLKKGDFVDISQRLARDVGICLLLVVAVYASFGYFKQQRFQNIWPSSQPLQQLNNDVLQLELFRSKALLQEISAAQEFQLAAKLPQWVGRAWESYPSWFQLRWINQNGQVVRSWQRLEMSGPELHRSLPVAVEQIHTASLKTGQIWLSHFTETLDSDKPLVLYLYLPVGRQGVLIDIEVSGRSRSLLIGRGDSAAPDRVVDLSSTDFIKVIKGLLEKESSAMVVEGVRTILNFKTPVKHIQNLFYFFWLNGLLLLLLILFSRIMINRNARRLKNLLHVTHALRLDAETTKQMANQSNSVKGVLLQTVSANMRQPLQNIFGVVAKLEQSTMSSSELSGVIGRLQLSSRRMLHMVRSILDVMRLVGKTEQVGMQGCSLQQLLEPFVTELNVDAKKLGIEIQIPSEFPRIDLRSDPGLLAHIFSSMKDELLTHEGVNHLSLEVFEQDLDVLLKFEVGPYDLSARVLKHINEARDENVLLTDGELFNSSEELTWRLIGTKLHLLQCGLRLESLKQNVTRILIRLPKTAISAKPGTSDSLSVVKR